MEFVSLPRHDDPISPHYFRGLMVRYWKWSLKLGTTTAKSPEEHFRFQAIDVEAIRQHKQGVGSGLWFQVRDGRMVDFLGFVDDPDRSLYDATTH